MDPAFEIDGRQYEWPGLMSLTNRECRIFYEETGVVWESLWLDGMTVKDMALKEGFMAAMARIAYTREHPDTADDEIKAVIDRQSRLSLFSAFLSAYKTDDESEEGKAAGADAPSESSSATSSEPRSTLNGTNDQPSSSGQSSESTSGLPDGIRAPTGTGGSDGRSTSPPLRQVI